jgi:hypothetical protein
MKISKLVMFAGAALSVASVAMAQTADQDRAYASELMTDAAVRTSALGAAPAGLTIGSGVNTLRIGGSVHARYNINVRDKDSVGGTNPKSFTHGFNDPRTSLFFAGNVGTEGLSYKIQGAFSDLGDSSSDGFGLEDAFINYDYGNGFSVRGGQFKFAFNRNTSLDNETLLIPNQYSSAASFFSQGRSQGIQGTYASDQFRVLFGFNDGFNQSNTNFNAASESDAAVNLRGEWQATGAPNWAIWDTDTSFRSQPDMALLIGAGLQYQTSGETGAVGGATVPDQDSISYTIDATLKDAGWHVSAAFLGRHVTPDVGSDVDDFGAYLQAGVFLADQWELFGRFDAIWADNASSDDFYTLAVGVNHYLVPESHAAVIYVVANYAFTHTAGAEAPVPSAGGFSNLSLTDGSQGFLGQADDGEFGISAGAQLRF